MREWLNKFGVYVVGGALVVAVILYFVMGSSAKAPSSNDVKAFYLDEETGEESLHPVSQVPPLIGKSGKPTVVQAIKYSCDGGKTKKIAYLRKYTPEAKEALDRAYATQTNPGINARANELVRLPEKGNEWYPVQSNEGATVTTNFPNTEGGTPVIVQP